MTDAIFIALTIAFFALMLAYVRACAQLGERDGSGGEEPHQ